jgi:hypothetical protein
MKRIILLLGVGAIALSAGCASKSTAMSSSQAEPVAASGTVAEQMPVMEPTSPVAETPVVAESKPDVASKSEKKQGIAALIDKLANNPLTLYWRERNAYTYYVGSEIEAEYKPQDGVLTLRQPNLDNAVECNISKSGDIESPAASEGQTSCKDLMFTLDAALSD